MVIFYAVAELELQLKSCNFDSSTYFRTQNGMRMTPYLCNSSIEKKAFWFFLPILSKDVSGLLVFPEFLGKIQFKNNILSWQ